MIPILSTVNYGRGKASTDILETLDSYKNIIFPAIKFSLSFKEESTSCFLKIVKIVLTMWETK